MIIARTNRSGGRHRAERDRGELGHREPSGRRRTRRRTVAVLAALSLPLATTLSAAAVTGVTQANSVKLVARGAVDTTNGFPTWYQDSRGTRLSLCLDGTNPFCGFLPGDIPDESQPIEFPGNFPDEAFYFLAGSTLNLPGGGRAVLTTGVEAAFANAVQHGDQMVFGRVRIVVQGAAPNSTLSFQHPYGAAQIDTDARGNGRLVEDIGASVGAFDAVLKSNVAPFLVATGGPVTGPDGAKYVGNPDQLTTVTGGLNGYNAFSVVSPRGNASTDQFTLMGRIATNVGVHADAAVVQRNGYVDVWATSEGSAVEVVGGSGYATTGMHTDPGSGRWYARVKLDGAAPGSVKVRNLSDNPASTSDVAVGARDLKIDQASYDGSVLHVTVTSPEAGTVTLEGLGDVQPGQAATFTVLAPPANVVAKQGGSTATRSVDVTGGEATIPLAPVPPSTTIDVDPAGEPSTSTGGTVTPSPTTPAVPAPVATVAATTVTAVRGATVTLDASPSTGAKSFSWEQIGGPATALSSTTTAKPTVTLPLLATGSATSPLTITNPPLVYRVTVTGAPATEGGTAPTSTAEVTVAPDVDQLTVTAARHRLGSELRIDGTGLFGGQARVLQPATQLVVWDTTPGSPVTKLGTATVDTLGAFSLRQKPGPTRQVTSILVQSSRGGSITSAVTTR
ncbi:hypothetical protein ACFFKU_07115 [Kineococcus gynurae]|uniref:Uncharacterized protein n=1 Tax=Kineococcus gynurae TaxID=452979 RepID=A0ABV5LWS4_9ACTN